MYEFIDAEKDAVTEAGEKKYSVVKMCDWLGVSTSGFYEWRCRPESTTAQRRAYLALLIRTIFEDSDETYGHRRIHAQLERHGEQCTRELVRRIMRDLGLEPCQPRPWGAGMNEPAASLLPDLVARTSPPPHLARKWLVISLTSPPGRDGCISPRAATAI